MNVEIGTEAAKFRFWEYFFAVYDHWPHDMGYYTVQDTALLNGSNVRLNWNIESDMNVYWIKFKIFLSLYWFRNKQHWI